MAKFKIFYSWQSDLPGNRTRNFIRECIDKAIDLAQEAEAIDAERDEATSGLTGSPDIVASLFSKIDACDLFVADISLCFTENSQQIKKSPNPNVLLELGYAVRTLGWERVICLCNKDFGDDYPFDIAHNRITAFSFEGKSRNEVKYDISEIIFVNIRDLRNLLPRPKNGMATHVIGTYDPESKKVVTGLVTRDLSRKESYTLHNNVLIQETQQLVAQIQELTIKMKKSSEEGCSKPKLENCTQDTRKSSQDERIQKYLKSYNDKGDTTIRDDNAIQALADALKASERPVVWESVAEDKECIARLLGLDVDEDFFDLGELKSQSQLINFNGPSYSGTDEEISKHEKLMELSYKLSLIDLRGQYLKTFDGMCFIPVAIQNISAVQDDNISVLIKVKSGKIIEPDEHLICPELEGLQGYICKDDDDNNNVGIITELFAPDTDGTIHLEEAPYAPTDYVPRIPVITQYGYSMPEKDEGDYKEELQLWVASSAGDGYYEFEISSLRPNECKWLSQGMLIQPADGSVKIHYSIRSSHSSGDIEGDLLVDNNED